MPEREERECELVGAMFVRVLFFIFSLNVLLCCVFVLRYTFHAVLDPPCTCLPSPLPIFFFSLILCPT